MPHCQVPLSDFSFLYSFDYLQITNIKLWFQLLVICKYLKCNKGLTTISWVVIVIVLTLNIWIIITNILFIESGNSEEISHTQLRRRRRSAGQYLEIKVVVAPDAAKFHGADTRKFVTTVLNIVSLSNFDFEKYRMDFKGPLNIKNLKTTGSSNSENKSMSLFFLNWRKKYLWGFFFFTKLWSNERNVVII